MIRGLRSWQWAQTKTRRGKQLRFFFPKHFHGKLAPVCYIHKKLETNLCIALRTSSLETKVFLSKRKQWLESNFVRYTYFE